ncbi:hypothetical protein [Pseudomonas sp. 31-12]|uniref:hypothetical protein n=1 Tax=Pseudomonas sp. 31-12 TaxID=2201356 RepID=UPI0021144647|nr:hypothetical protein [Pseudomonas sp. 31-12]
MTITEDESGTLFKPLEDEEISVFFTKTPDRNGRRRQKGQLTYIPSYSEAMSMS